MSADGNADASGDASGKKEDASGKKEAIKPGPLKTLAALVVFFSINALMQPTSFVRWSLADMLGTGHPTKLPKVLVLEGHQGTNGAVVSGEYVLLGERVHGRPAWFKDNPEQRAYLLWDKCGAWLITQYPDGNAPKCDGWTFAFCPKMPWDCKNTWQTREDNNWIQDPSLRVTAAWDGSQALSDNCSADDEESLTGSMNDFDVVIPWINGSDPEWLSRRADACAAWQWALWPDAVTRSAVTKSCLQEEAALKEANEFYARGHCSDGAFGKEGVCSDSATTSRVKKDSTSRPQVERGLTVYDSICFQRFIANHCAGRLKTIKDHDELRYLIRSLENHMSWHRGRILLLSPRGQIPNWLRPSGRLKVIVQEELLQAVVSSPWYIANAERDHISGFAPDRIFNDYPLEAALPFIPDVHRVVMLLQDDILFARPVTPCNFFTVSPTGLQLYARPFHAEKLQDEYDAIYGSIQRWSFDTWKGISDQAVQQPTGKKGQRKLLEHSYYQDMHLPNMLHTNVMLDLWREHSDVMSSIVDAAFRFPNLSSAIALHHSQLIRMARLESQPSSSEGDDRPELISNSKVINLAAHSGTSLPLEQRQWLEIVIQSAQDWREKTKRILPDSLLLPTFISFQDGLGDEAESQAAELDCLREKWLNELLPVRSTFEDLGSPPNRCLVYEAKRAVKQNPTDKATHKSSQTHRRKSADPEL